MTERNIRTACPQPLVFSLGDEQYTAYCYLDESVVEVINQYQSAAIQPRSMVARLLCSKIISQQWQMMPPAERADSILDIVLASFISSVLEDDEDICSAYEVLEELEDAPYKRFVEAIALAKGPE